MLNLVIVGSLALAAGLSFIIQKTSESQTDLKIQLIVTFTSGLLNLIVRLLIKYIAIH